MNDRARIGRRIAGTLHRPKRQLAMVFDLNKCIGCQTCTIACKQQWTREEGMDNHYWTVVNTVPGHGTPRNWEHMGGGFQPDGTMRPGLIPTRAEFGDSWDVNKKDVFFGGEAGDRGGLHRYLQPQDSHGAKPANSPNWDEDIGAGDYPNSYYFYLPRLCNHCTHPACLEACPRGAIYKREADGIVILNESQCKGYRFCKEACPYKRIYYNHVRDVSQKCIFCFPRLARGVAPACARQCPGRMRFVGYSDDENGPIYKLVTKYRVALPLHEEYGTQPNVFYVPPFAPPALTADGRVDPEQSRIPLAFLEGLFGPRVRDALQLLETERARKQRGEPSELMDTLIVYRWPDDIFPDFPVDPASV